MKKEDNQYSKEFEKKWSSKGGKLTKEDQKTKDELSKS